MPITSLLAYRVLMLSSTLAQWTGPKYLQRFGLKPTERRILSVVGARGSASVNAVSKMISIDKAWISRTVPRLVKSGLVRVTGDHNDRRRRVLVITPKGASVHDRISRMSLNREKRQVKALTRGELDEFRRLLGVLQSEAERMLKEQRK